MLSQTKRLIRGLPIVTKLSLYTHWRVHIVEALKNKKRCGLEGISKKVLKFCSPIIRRHLTKCIDESIFLELLGTALDLPKFRKRDKNDPVYYRPVSLLNVLSKVVTKIPHSGMLRFTEKNNLIFPTHYGFRFDIATKTDVIRTNSVRKHKMKLVF